MQSRVIATVSAGLLALSATSALAAGTSSTAGKLNQSATSTVASSSVREASLTAPAFRAARASTGQPTTRPGARQPHAYPMAAGPAPSSDSSPRWQTRTLVSTTLPVVVTAIGLNAATVDGRPDRVDPRIYDIAISAAGMPVETLQVFTAGQLTGTLHQQLLHIDRQAADLTVDVRYRYDPAQAVCLAGVNGACAANLPFDPAGSSWATTHAGEADLIVDAAADVDGTREAQSLAVPVVGQLLGIVP